KQELKSSDRSKKSDTASESRTVDDENLFLNLFANTIGAVFKYGLIGDYKSEGHLHNTLALYPYSDGASGNYTPDSVAAKKFRIDLEDRFLYSNNDLFGNHLKAT